VKINWDQECLEESYDVPGKKTNVNKTMIFFLRGKAKCTLIINWKTLYMPTQAGGWTVTSQYIWYGQGFQY
jgi:hypothetical protein